MKNHIKYITLAFAMVFLVSCSDYPSLQKYYVDSQESMEFISLDIPASIVSLKDTDASDDVKSTLKSIKKINFLGFQITEENAVSFSNEKTKVKEILKNPKYQELMRLTDKGRTLIVNFLGEQDAIDEIIIYGSDKELGFALVRVLGDKMDPAKMMQLVNEVNLDDDLGSMQQIGVFMKNFN
jgi:hypothetical protein